MDPSYELTDDDYRYYAEIPAVPVTEGQIEELFAEAGDEGDFAQAKSEALKAVTAEKCGYQRHLIGAACQILMALEDKKVKGASEVLQALQAFHDEILSPEPGEDD